ncbi:hypothetical protein SAMN05444858_12067 [Micromonospora avicenniae]|uniref:Uncharacterized protein n=1 Tax=Micromonospora avicenniae TaxID=1198245 RepID=A0A1N7E4C7_9ACTN|nr:hypothetical protein SAMN05444858_12067 [Micromonospora avicenniae]
MVGPPQPLGVAGRRPGAGTNTQYSPVPSTSRNGFSRITGVCGMTKVVHGWLSPQGRFAGSR